MLVLSRKVGSKVQIGEAQVTVLSVAGNVIRLAIEAPPSVKVLREEAKRKAAA